MRYLPGRQQMGYFLSLSDNDLRVSQVGLIFLAWASEAEKNHRKKDNSLKKSNIRTL